MVSSWGYCSSVLAVTFAPISERLASRLASVSVNVQSCYNDAPISEATVQAMGLELASVTVNVQSVSHLIIKINILSHTCHVILLFLEPK